MGAGQKEEFPLTSRRDVGGWDQGGDEGRRSWERQSGCGKDKGLGLISRLMAGVIGRRRSLTNLMQSHTIL